MELHLPSIEGFRDATDILLSFFKGINVKNCNSQQKERTQSYLFKVQNSDRALKI